MHLFVEKLSLRSFLSITLFLRERSFHSKSVHLQYIYNDVFLTNDKGSLRADKVDYNFETKYYKVSMFDNTKVKIKHVK